MAGKRKMPAKQVDQEPDYRQFFKTAKEVMFITSKKGEWVDFNDAALDLFGFATREELAAVKISTLYAKPTERKNHIRQIDTQGFVKDYPVHLVRKDGSDFSAFISTTAIRNGDGNITSYMGIIREVPGEQEAGKTLQKKNEYLIAANEDLTAKEGQLRVLVENLSESEKKFHSLFDAMGEGVALHEIIFDKDRNARDYRIIEVNPAFEINTGIPADSIKGKTASNVYGTSDAPYLDIYARVASGGTPESFEVFFEPLDRHFHISVFSPKQGWFATVFSDISEKTRLEEERALVYRELADQHTLFSAIINSAVSNIFSVDREYRYTSFNRQHAVTMNALFGSEIKTGKNILDFITIEKDKSAMKKNLDRALSGETVMDEGYTGDHSLSRQYMEPSFNPIRNPGGVVIGVAVISRDGTERKKAEKALRASEERYRRLTENSRDIIFRFLLPDRKFEYVNPVVQVLTGHAPGEFYQNPALMLAIIHPDFRERFKTQWERLPKGDIPREYEYQILHTSGECRWFHQRNTIVRDSTGHIVALEGIITDITDRKSTEIQLKQIEERYRLISENTGDVIWFLDLETMRFTFVSPSVYRLLGYTSEEVMTLTLSDILTPDALAQVTNTIPTALDAIRNADESTRIQTHYLDQVRKDGSIISVEIVATLLNNERSGKLEVLGVSRDITDRKRAEDALRESEQRYRTFVESANEAIFVIQDGKIPFCNKKGLDLIGYDIAYLVSHSFLDLLHPDDRKQALERHMRRLNGESFEPRAELRVIDAKGVLHWLEINAVIVPWDGRQSTLNFGTDITERKKADDALRESEHHYHLLADNVQDVIWTADRDMRITYVSPSITAIMGYSPAEFLQLSPKECLTPDSFRTLFASRQECLTNIVPGYPDTLKPQILELEYLRKDRTQIWAEVVISLIRSEKGEPLGMIGVTRDITDRKLAEEALHNSEEYLMTIINSVQTGLAIVDPVTLRIVDVNPSAATMIGAKREEIIGSDCHQFICPDKERRCPVTHPGCTVDNTECTLLSVNGPKLILKTIVPIEFSGTHYLLESFIDITDRKEAEKALRNSETYLKTIINSVQTGLVIIDPETHTIVDVNPAAEKMTGVGRETIIGSCCHKFICPAEEGSCPVTDKGHSVDNSERTLITRNGPVSILKTVVPTTISGKNFLLESFIDITDRKRAEAALLESEEKFHLIFKNSNDAIYLFEITPSGMPGRIVDANEVALLHTGHTKESLLTKSFLEIHSHELPQKSRTIMMELLTKGQIRFETDVLRRDGTKLPVEVSAQFAKFNQKTYVIAISRDVSRRKREERALRIVNQKLQLMNIVAWHDIQNKVTGLRGYVELSKDLVTDETMKKFIQSEEEVLKVIHQQLQYTKEYQEMGVHPQEWVNLHQTLRMILSLAELGVIQVVIEVGNLEIYCDPVIAKVFSHLFDNTRIHGMKATKIHISCRESGDNLLLIYEDDGVGISDEQKKELFMRNVGTTTGFSLFFIHDILEVSDMTIRETGVPGEGVRFEIGIPRGIYRFGNTSR